MTKMVGICGLAFHGKDTAAEALVNQAGYTKLAFADPIREALLELNPIVVTGRNKQRTEVGTEYDVYLLDYLSNVVESQGWDTAKKGDMVRRQLQVFGTEICRNLFGHDCWINVMDKRIKALRSQDSNASVVIPDTRFGNEAEYIKDNGGLIIYVRRNIDTPRMSHASESLEAAQVADFVVDNNGSVAELHERILEICGHKTTEAIV